MAGKTTWAGQGVVNKAWSKALDPLARWEDSLRDLEEIKATHGHGDSSLLV